MTDSDVQDVRDMVAQQKAEDQEHQALIAQMKRLAEQASMNKDDLDMLHRLKELSAKYEQRRRLGLDSSELGKNHRSDRST
ncbi:hypothetical protein FA15DRAFT_703881 [Coprinopsis marcescibilis]|uniref:Uncharacterized protein n=1 Tax=Coprinopsis marcescibilis TaxID=230819 RepID=A0A5C3KXP4_COPMA|nr:hypothetical protein FA15DRAFT_703881 [Coprinopsis marcescibilis]